MSNGEFISPEQQALLRMVRESGTPQDAGRALMSRLEMLEAQVAELEAYVSHEAAVQGASETAAEAPAESLPAAEEK